MSAFANMIPGYTENEAGNAIDFDPRAIVVLLGISDFSRLSFCPGYPPQRHRISVMPPSIECPTGPRQRVSIEEAPITEQYKAHAPPTDTKLVNSGIAQTTYAPTSECPFGTTKGDWAEKHQHQTVSCCHLGDCQRWNTNWVPGARTTLFLLRPGRRRRHLAFGHIPSVPVL